MQPTTPARTSFASARCITCSLFITTFILFIPRRVFAFRSGSSRSLRQLAQSSITSARQPPPTTSTACRAFADGALQAVESFYQTQPYMSAFLTCSIKASTADWVVQTRTIEEEQQQQRQEKQKQVQTPLRVKDGTEECDVGLDVSRNFAFLVHGGLYQGMAQEFLYSQLYPTMFGSGSWSSVAIQVFFDMFLMGPFVYMPTVYACKSICARHEISAESIRAGMSRYRDDITLRGILTKFWAVWVPVQFLTFGVIPLHYRVLFVASVSFFWVIILSAVSGSTSTEEEDLTS